MFSRCRIYMFTDLKDSVLLSLPNKFTKWPVGTSVYAITADSAPRFSSPTTSKFQVDDSHWQLPNQETHATEELR